MRCIATALLMWAAGCDRHPAPAAVARHPTVASLVPAATDLIIGMGASDHLVAVSNYDVSRPQTANLPRVGDYQNFDWEQIASIRPDMMIVFMTPDRMPAERPHRATGRDLRGTGEPGKSTG
jgi:ABC-type hemin transport system substrate-binding protein